MDGWLLRKVVINWACRHFYGFSFVFWNSDEIKTKQLKETQENHFLFLKKNEFTLCEFFFRFLVLLPIEIIYHRAPKLKWYLRKRNAKWIYLGKTMQYTQNKFKLIFNGEGDRKLFFLYFVVDCSVLDHRLSTKLVVCRLRYGVVRFWCN